MSHPKARRRRATLEELPGAPPALLLMLREFAPGRSWTETRKRIRGLLGDLRDQSMAFDLGNVARAEDKGRHSSFDIHLHGALDVLSGQGCIHFPCRVAAAERLARSVGLIADRVWLTDHLSTQFITMGRATNVALDRAMADALVLAHLIPLIEAGIVRFRSPWIPTCQNCSAEFERQVEATTQRLLRSYTKQFKLERRPDGGYIARTGACFEPPLMFRSYNSAIRRIPTVAEYAEQAIADEVRTTLWTAREASFTHGSVFTNSRLGLAGLLHQDGRLPSARSLVLLDRQRQFEIPWVSDLSPEQIVELREEASLALPAFRERLAKALVCTDANGRSDLSTFVIQELREQAADVRAELVTKQAKAARYWKTTYGLLGLALSAYGVATDQVLAGVGGLLPVLHLLINHRTGHEAEMLKLTTRPGYVLVKAQDLLAHSH